MYRILVSMTALLCLDKFSVCGFAGIMTLTTIAYGSAVQAESIVDGINLLASIAAGHGQYLNFQETRTEYW